MSTTIISAIAEIKSKIAAKEREILPLRITVNELCKIAGLPEEYPGADASGNDRTTTATTSLNWRSDQFFGRPLATCVAEYFEARKKAGMEGPATIDDIFEALQAGGFKFEGATGSEANTKRAIKISLTKNTAQFVKVKDDLFALKKWYSMRGPRKATGKIDDDESDTTLPASEPEAASEDNAEIKEEPVS
jgi:hypothetical protein